MKIVVIGGTGLIGSKTVAILRQGPRKVVGDPEARYWGGRVEERSLVPLGEARLGRIGFDEWLRRSRAAA
jgi:nucleoside-diphosphate-sugar epimerase